jgi:hypothetical protein
MSKEIIIFKEYSVFFSLPFLHTNQASPLALVAFCTLEHQALEKLGSAWRLPQ